MRLGAILRKIVVVAALAAAAFAVPASASTIVSGCVTYFSGFGPSVSGCTQGNSYFKHLSTPFTSSNPDNTVGNDTFQKPYLHAFEEQQNVTVPNAITVDVGSNLTVGELVNISYVFFDPEGSRKIQGYVEFDAPIIGVLTGTTDEKNSDSTYGATGVTYLSPSHRGLELTTDPPYYDSVKIDPSDPNRLLIYFMASTPGDYVRVFTEVPSSGNTGGGQTPIPASLPLFGSALGVLGWLELRKRKRAAA